MNSFKNLLDTLTLELNLAKGVKIKSIIFLFRISSYFYKGKSFFRFLLLPLVILYKIYSEFFLGIELPAQAVISEGLRLHHGIGLVIHKGVKIGRNCTLRQGVTIGNKGEGDQASLLPNIGNNVEFGANSIVIGGITIGDNVVIGAGAVITKNIPSNCIVVGAKSRIIENNSVRTT